MSKILDTTEPGKLEETKLILLVIMVGSSTGGNVRESFPAAIWWVKTHHILLTLYSIYSAPSGLALRAKSEHQ